jgi:MoaA/NifB/PqqE/SkfB family radical SAM enzyme
MDEFHRIGPNVMPSHTGVECSSIYGFSDKGPYDEFCANSGLELRPYPLVARYLQNQIDALDDVLKLVVIDATGPSEPRLCAATMEVLLEALENRAAHVTAGYQLVFDQEADAYRVEEVA